MITLSQLAESVNATGSRYFSAGNMRFFGDTAENMGVRDAGDCWELYRKSPINWCGGDFIPSSTFFKKWTFEQVNRIENSSN